MQYIKRQCLLSKVYLAFITDAAQIVSVLSRVKIKIVIWVFNYRYPILTFSNNKCIAADLSNFEITKCTVLAWLLPELLSTWSNNITTNNYTLSKVCVIQQLKALIRK